MQRGAQSQEEATPLSFPLKRVMGSAESPLLFALTMRGQVAESLLGARARPQVSCARLQVSRARPQVSRAQLQDSRYALLRPKNLHVRCRIHSIIL